MDKLIVIFCVVFASCVIKTSDAKIIDITDIGNDISRISVVVGTEIFEFDTVKTHYKKHMHIRIMWIEAYNGDNKCFSIVDLIPLDTLN